MTTTQRRPIHRQWWLVAYLVAFIAISVGFLLQKKEAHIIDIPTEEDCSCAATLGLQGNISDCCCSFSDVEQVNLETVHPLLQKVVQTPFFSHFKMDLCSSCQLWDDAPLCILRDCGVCECEEPPQWATDVDWMPKSVTCGLDEDCEHLDDQVVTTVDHHVEEGWTADPSSFLGLAFDGEDEQEQDSSSNGTPVVVDLRLNPEQYTGYSGQSAEKVWTAIHADNCFQSDDDTELCSEQRIYNRILSGLHSSISLHIAHSFCLEVDPDRTWACKTWGPNATLARERVLDHPERLENLYVAFAIVLRAVQKVGPAVTAAVPKEDGFFAESLDEWTESLLPELIKLEHNCPLTFDETIIFSEEEDNHKTNKRLELQRRFGHLQQIMECVGCDRCKLWGTLQTLGIGTALRVLLGNNEGAALDLSRQEAVALVHTLERLSSSLDFANDLRRDAPI